MQDAQFCPQCGTALAGDDLFCPACGTKLSEAPSPPVVQSVPPTQPISGRFSPDVAPEKLESPSPISSGKSLLPWVLVGVVLVVAASAGWYWWKHRTPASGANVASGSATTVTPPAPVAPDADAVTLDAFVGIWHSYWANSSQEQDIRVGNAEDDVFVEVKQGTFHIYPRSNSHKGADLTTECQPLQGSKLTCDTWRKDAPGDRYRMTYTLSADREELTISDQPSASEPMIVKYRRVSDHVSAAGTSSSLLSPLDTPDEPVPMSQSYFPPVKGPLSEAQALARVEFIPEVKAWLRELRAKGAKPHITLADRENGQYIVHCYAMVEDGEYSHTATLGWYSVDIQTGRVDFWLP